MLNLICASFSFGLAVWMIDYSLIAVALNVASGVFNFGIAIKPTTNA
tara:strand:- start:226 stop:366 length:141 start_codon:yes stop_codon:yes gene_type:complete